MEGASLALRNTEMGRDDEEEEDQLKDDIGTVNSRRGGLQRGKNNTTKGQEGRSDDSDDSELDI